MSEELMTLADRRLADVLERSDARDPREFHRERLRELKAADPSKYEEAVAYYRDALIPRVAADGSDPLSEWTEFGRRLAEAVAPGRTVCVDTSGRAAPYRAPAPPDSLVLHLADGRGSKALLVGLPAELSTAQRATYDVLVLGKQKQKG